MRAPAEAAQPDEVSTFAASIIAATQALDSKEGRVLEVKNRILRMPEILLDGNYDRLMNLVDSLLGQPQFKWGLGLDLADALLAAGSELGYQDSLTRLIARFPNEFWVWFFWVKAAQRLSSRETYWLRACHASNRFPDDRRLHHLLAHAGMITRRFDAVLAIPNLDQLKDGQLIRRKAQTYINLREQFTTPCRVDYGLYCVNLDHHAARLEALKSDLIGLPVALRRVPAVRGSYLPKALRLALERHNRIGAPSRHAGAFGCFLSHVSAWEAFLKTSDDFALMVEDDTRLLASLPAAISLLDLPKGTDIVFINERTEFAARWDRDIACRTELVDWDVAMKSRPAAQNSVGTDGYILSRAGAHKALDLVVQGGFPGDIDWWLARATRSPLKGPSEPADGSAEDDRGVLFGYSLFPSLVTSGGFGSSRIVESDMWQKYT